MGRIDTIEHLLFRPLLGLRSPHVQMILAKMWNFKKSLSSQQLLVPLDDGDVLCCEVSTPTMWQPHEKTILMLHGLGGSHDSNYMVRLAYKFTKAGMRVVRINMRGCGSGVGLAKFPYHAGRSSDILSVIQALKQQAPHSTYSLIGFSLGGNIALKLASEAGHLLQQTIAVCAPLDLAQTVATFKRFSNRIYEFYFLNSMRQQLAQFAENRNYATIYDFDNNITAPRSGFRGADDYYAACSSRHFIPSIKHPCRLLLAADDPFIDYRPVLDLSLAPEVKISVCKYGGHMGFLSWTDKEHGYFWLDRLLMDWINQVG